MRVLSDPDYRFLALAHVFLLLNQAGKLCTTTIVKSEGVSGSRYLPVYVCTHINSCTCIHIHTYIYICVSICIRTYMYTHIHKYMYIYLYLPTHVHIYICIHICKNALALHTYNTTTMAAEGPRRNANQHAKSCCRSPMLGTAPACVVAALLTDARLIGELPKTRHVDHRPPKEQRSIILV